MIKIGQKVKFNPFKGMQSMNTVGLPTEVVGNVKYVNAKHRWFSVEYGDDVKLRISFNFNDIGNAVKLCK